MSSDNLLKGLDQWRLNQWPEKERLDVIAMGFAVPKIIHQTYPTRALPPEIQENCDRLKALNPNWQYCFYDDAAIETYIKTNFPSVFEFYQQINPKYGAARADLFRYLLMYREGGVYLDIKGNFSKPLDDIIKPAEKMLLSHWRNGEGERFEGWGLGRAISDPKGEFQQCFIIATQGHPFLKAVIENVLSNIAIYNPYLHGVGRSGVLRTTGPVAFTLAITPLLPLHEYRLVESDKDLGFIYSIYDKDPSKHHTELFKTHYTNLEESVITLNIKRKISCVCLYLALIIKSSMLDVVVRIRRKIRLISAP